MRIRTQIIPVNPHHPEEEAIAFAALVIRSGKLVAFPTETVYGLGANAFDSEAVLRIFKAKGRPSADPLIVHLASKDDLRLVTKGAPEIAWKLAEKFWPGPLTLVLPKSGQIPLEITAGLNTVAVRVPAHPVALALLKKCQLPIAAPSANRFGHTSPTTAQHVYDDLAGEIDLILDGGATIIGVESTVLDITKHPPRILRPGGVTLEQLTAVLGEVDLTPTSALNDQLGALRSPGQLEKHYAPRAKLIFFTNPDVEKAVESMISMARQAKDRHQQVGIMLMEEDRPFFEELAAVLFSLGEGKDPAVAAARLYDGMRALDQARVDLILVRDFGGQGIGLAIRDRLKRAASQIVT